MSLTMGTAEREAFLADTHVGVIAVSRGERGPLAVPIWYAYRVGGEVVLWIERGSAKERLIRDAGRFSLCAQVEEPPYKYVTVEGPVVAWEEAPSAGRALEIALRYMPADEAADFVERSLSDKSMLVRMSPELWLSRDEGQSQK